LFRQNRAVRTKAQSTVVLSSRRIRIFSRDDGAGGVVAASDMAERMVMSKPRVESDFWIHP
jgi:hypothetical protein